MNHIKGENFKTNLHMLIIYLGSLYSYMKWKRKMLLTSCYNSICTSYIMNAPCAYAHTAIDLLLHYYIADSSSLYNILVCITNSVRTGAYAHSLLFVEFSSKYRRNKKGD